MRNTTQATSQYSVDAIANGLRTLRLIERHGQITVTELSAALGVGKSTAHRILQTMVDEKFVSRDPVKRNYHAGQAFVTAGLSVLGNFDVRRRAHVPMVKLAEQTGETFKILTLEGPYTRVLHMVRGNREPEVFGRVGEILYAHATAGGKLLLSNEKQDQLVQRLGKRLPSLTEHTITDWDELIMELRTIRERRWATSFEESSLGFNGLAVPIIGHNSVPFAALAMTAPTERLTQGGHRDILGMLMNAAQQMAQPTNEPGHPQQPPQKPAGAPPSADTGMADSLHSSR